VGADKNAYIFVGGGGLKERNNSEDLDVDRKIALKLMLRK
jgi:hypothetical protein